jgi:hypothetical protein
VGTPADRDSGNDVMALVASYRTRYNVRGDTLLGTAPLEAHQRADYEAVLAELRAAERRQGRSLVRNGRANAAGRDVGLDIDRDMGRGR